MTEASILSDLQQNASELNTAVSKVISTVLSPEFSWLLRYFASFSAYLQSKESATPLCDCFPCLCCIQQLDFTKQQTRNELLDDLFCLLTFLQERLREWKQSADEHFLAIGCNAEIART